MYARITNLENQLGPTLNSIVAQELAVAGTAVAPTVLNDLSTHAWISVRSNSVYVTFDGTDPVTATPVGILLASGYNGIWSKRLVNNAKFIQGSGAAKVRIEPLSE
jgi:hypothetical protein